MSSSVVRVSLSQTRSSGSSSRSRRDLRSTPAAARSQSETLQRSPGSDRLSVPCSGSSSSGSSSPPSTCVMVRTIGAPARRGPRRCDVSDPEDACGVRHHGQFTRWSRRGTAPVASRRHRGGMRIALVTETFFPSSPSRPGAHRAETTVKALADRLLDTGHEVSLVAPGPGLTTYRGAAGWPACDRSGPGARCAGAGGPRAGPGARVLAPHVRRPRRSSTPPGSACARWSPSSRPRSTSPAEHWRRQGAATAPTRWW